MWEECFLYVCGRMCGRMYMYVLVCEECVEGKTVYNKIYSLEEDIKREHKLRCVVRVASPTNKQNIYCSHFYTYMCVL